ncbi:ankyrin repeat protein [Colletotrichum chrysophilum]|uniref:Ankyrin repeat protein n=1 Tax=Colletotrichum chrysophilum TaxID=1836956 RepID=A0AAD9EK34_9PEZI|nr:ankyrin repeat protein [Colletotrichum chrysophilum]
MTSLSSHCRSGEAVPKTADPLSIAASIAGLISLADIVFIRLIKYRKSIKDAEKELGELAKEVNLLGGALNSLVRLARELEAGSFDSNLRMHNIEDCSDSLIRMNSELSKIDTTSVRTKLFRPISTDQVREWLDVLSRHKQNINLALSADTMDVMLSLLAKEDQHTEIAKETRCITIRIHEAMDDANLLNFYVTHNPQQNYDMSLRLRHGRTGLWLIRLPEFQQWLRSTGNSRLWLKGIPGAGKTVLAASIIEAALGESSDSIACAFFFCDYKVSATHNIENILLSIVYQLSLQKQEAYDLLKRHYKRHNPAKGLPSRPSETDLKMLLQTILEMYIHVYLVIDGLDECGKYTADVVGALADVARASSNTSIALLSRDEDDVRHFLHEDFISIEVAAHKQDIIEYITTEIEERTRRRKLDLHDTELKAEVLSRLVNGANGM